MPFETENKLIRFVFFGNYFYGICAIGLAIEATLQQQFLLNTPFFYLAMFAATVVYYTSAYTSEPTIGTANLRTNWYIQNKNYVSISQGLLACVAGAYLVYFIYNYWQGIVKLPLLQWAVILVFPIVGALYYGLGNKTIGNYNLRNIGWLKPFVIGFAWAGMVNVYPAMAWCVEHGTAYQPTIISYLLFLKNFMFVSVLCIMFDFKDYASDYNKQLKTFVVNFGLRKTIFYILLPLCAIGLGSFIGFGIIRHFSVFKILINTIPFILLIAVAYSMYRRKSILYYLIIIDGLMLVKAICGTIAMVYF